MIWNLIKKDLRAHHKSILLIILGYSVYAGTILVHYYPWNMYMMIGYFAMISTGTMFVFSDKKQHTEILVASLPVTRTQIVLARYLASIGISLFGLFLWYVNALIYPLLFTDLVTDFQWIVTPKVVFMAFILLSIYYSFFLPAVFSFQWIGMIVLLLIALILAILPIPTIFQPYKSTYIPYFESTDLVMITVFFILLVSLPIVSILLSIKIYQKKDV